MMLMLDLVEFNPIRLSNATEDLQEGKLRLIKLFPSNDKVSVMLWKECTNNVVSNERSSFMTESKCINEYYLRGS